MPIIRVSQINPIEMDDDRIDAKAKKGSKSNHYKMKPVKDSKTKPAFLEKSHGRVVAETKAKAHNIDPTKKPSLTESSESDESDRYSPLGSYEGERNESGERHGYGKAVLISNSGQEDFYQGYYMFNKRHGLGTYTFSNGARYVGDYVNNKKHGHGIFIYPDGSKYTGEWVNDVREGLGTYEYPNGDVYEGQWKSHVRHGQGVYTYADSTKYVGEWANGKLKGVCQFVNPSYTFEGNFRDNVPIGGGKFIFSNSTKAVKFGKYLAVPCPNQLDQEEKPVIINKWFE